MVGLVALGATESNLEIGRGIRGVIGVAPESESAALVYIGRALLNPDPVVAVGLGGGDGGWEQGSAASRASAARARVKRKRAGRIFRGLLLG